MRRRRIDVALAVLVFLGASLGGPAFADDHVDDKHCEIERLRDYELTQEEQALTAAMLADEQHRIAYGDVAVPTVSPGFGIARDGRAVVRIYPGVDIEEVEHDLELRGLKALVVPSRYLPAEKAALEAALTGISLHDGEFFGFAYDAFTDLVSVSGTVPWSTVAAAVGDQLPFAFEQASTGGRMPRR